MIFQNMELPGIVLISPRKIEDHRGYFFESFREDLFNEYVGSAIHFVQDNRSFSTDKNTVRGLHCQVEPKAQGKLVQCVRGSILDVVVDIRPGSTTFGQHVKTTLSAKNMQQLWVPKGFLHGYLTLEDNTEVQYKCTDFFASDLSRSVDWQDSELGIDWGIPGSDAILSSKDLKAPSFEHFALENSLSA
jgi:dTDP-4-dehydrorhamnose 3,5-epimerase